MSRASDFPPLPAADLEDVLNATRELWAEARGHSFFVTGGTGFFGIWLLETFVFINETLGLDMSMTVLTRSPEAFARKVPHLAGKRGLSFLAGDIGSFRFPTGEFSYLVHAATEVSDKLADAAVGDTFDTIVGGTRRVLEFAGQAGTKKLLLTSSGAVYGRQPPDLVQVPETHGGAPDPLTSASAYGEAKRAAELLVAAHGRQHGYEAKIARCFAFVGPHLPLDRHFAIGNFIRDAMAGQEIVVRGDGTPTRSYLYASDLAIWLWTLLFRGAAGRAYNVGSDESHSIAEVAETVRRVLGSLAPVKVSQFAASSIQAIQRYVPSTRRAKEELGLAPRVGLEEGIRKTDTWQRTAPARMEA